VTVSGNGIRWAICKSAPCSRQITMPAPHHRPSCHPTISVKALKANLFIYISTTKYAKVISITLQSFILHGCHMLITHWCYIPVFVWLLWLSTIFSVISGNANKQSTTHISANAKTHILLFQYELYVCHAQSK